MPTAIFMKSQQENNQNITSSKKKDYEPTNWKRIFPYPTIFEWYFPNITLKT
jgi:hypothetical protein